MDFQRLEKVSQDCLNSNVANDMVETRRTDLAFHKLLVQQAGNECLIDLFKKVQGQFMVANYLESSHTSKQQGVAADEHEQLLQALKDGDFDTARAVVTRHIKGACEKIISRIKD